jgi:ArsR family transcriptional regulator, arsenate/arsenite/antimonite-responsive transcriptional repressor
VTVQTLPGLPIAAGATCCPLLREPLSASQAAGLAHILKALADPTRLRLVSMVAAHEGGQACVCDLTDPLGLTQPTISHHLKILVDAGIFTRDKRGKWAYYALVPAALEALSAVLSTGSQGPIDIAGALPGNLVTRGSRPAAQRQPPTAAEGRS